MVRLARRAGEDADILGNGMIIVAIAALIGGRAYHVIDQWALYQDDPIKIFLPPYSGLGVYGGIATGTIAAFLYARYKRVPFLRWADIIAPGLFVMQAIARWGNFFNQELYGTPTTLPWGIPIDCAHRIAAYPCGTFPSSRPCLPSAVPVRVDLRAARRALPHLARVPRAAAAPAGRPAPDLLRLVRRGPVRPRDVPRRTTGRSSGSRPRRSCRCCSSSRRWSSWPGATARATRSTTRRRIPRVRHGAPRAAGRAAARSTTTRRRRRRVRRRRGRRRRRRRADGDAGEPDER